MNLNLSNYVFLFIADSDKVATAKPFKRHPLESIGESMVTCAYFVCIIIIIVRPACILQVYITCTIYVYTCVFMHDLHVHVHT